MQGFFRKPVDNLRAEPLIARWIRNHVKDWREAVVVSKNAGGSKRVTSLADALKLSFGIITTDKRRVALENSVHESDSANTSQILDESQKPSENPATQDAAPKEHDTDSSAEGAGSSSNAPHPTLTNSHTNRVPPSPHEHASSIPRSTPRRQNSLPLASSAAQAGVSRGSIVSDAASGTEHRDFGEVYTDERAREVITGRLVQGHIVDDDFPSPMLSTMSGSVATLPGDPIGPPQLPEERDVMTASFTSVASSAHGEHPLGGTYDAAALSEEEEAEFNDPEIEHTVTLVGDVAHRTVFIIDDIIDRPEPWIAAAETVVKRGAATSVYCIATHALFGGDSLERMQRCGCIDYIVVCNTFPIDPQCAARTDKLVVLDLAPLLAEAIRRNHHGESISQLYASYQD